MSTRASSAKTFATSSLQDSVQESDPRWRQRGVSEHSLSLSVETSHHSYPKTPGMMPAAYGQHQDLRPFNRSQTPDPHCPQPQTHAVTGGAIQQPQTHAVTGGAIQQPSSPFVHHAPAAGFPVQQFQRPVQPPMINPLPFNLSSPYPVAHAAQPPPPAFTQSASGYIPYNYNQRANTTGSMYPGQQGIILPPSTSYSVPFGGHLPPQSKSNEDYTDDCFNIFWLFFLLGPLTWPCAIFGVCSEKQSERMAGFVSGICLVLVIIAAVIIITQAPGDSDS